MLGLSDAVVDLVESGMQKHQAEKEAPIFKKAHQMLIKWEEEDITVRSLWKKMNGWVFDGFNATYKRLGVNFDKNYYESDTYLLGKEVVESYFSYHEARREMAWVVEVRSKYNQEKIQ